MDSYEKAYTPKEISLTLDIGDSTLRKWCIALENQGYQFIRNDQNKRVFVDANIVVLRHFKELVQNHSMQLNNAAMLVIDRFGKGTFSQGTDVVPVKNNSDLDRSNDEVISKLMNYIEQQEERFEKQEQFNRTLLERLDQQQKYIEERLNQRDETLIQSLREVQETKKLIAAAEEKRDEENKKGFLQRLFGK
ncbi:DUF3967 domain-containing protein [Metabacillus litoralis]|uniref:DUF3967 domain-containing protein n=1 Tax=Metabacillus litoralis TaxID=152268 RepID=UPI00203C0BC3|nr:DUF3967 domain-containing protein [Metabacillus litoralis]MCM3165104.1 DUF3967 domain-containing protein [Metabacillus litoralis]